jgi:beta propeller repeat protein
LPASVPAGIPNRGVDYGLDAGTTDREGSVKLVHFSTEILYEGEPSFTDGDVLQLGNDVIHTNYDLISCFEPKTKELGLDALFIAVEQIEREASSGRRSLSDSMGLNVSENLVTVNAEQSNDPRLEIALERSDRSAASSSDIVLYDLLDSSQTAVCSNPDWQTTPAVYGDRIVWADYRNGWGNWDIYMYDYALGIEMQVTTETHNQTQPAIYEDKIVYIDNRSGNDDVYLYNLTTMVETPICTDPAIQLSPAIYDDKIVWMDYRNGFYTDVYMYDLSTSTEIPIAIHSSHWQPSFSGGGYVSIHEDRIVWMDYRNGNADIYMYDLSTSTETQITTNSRDQGFPDIYGDVIVWQDNRNSPTPLDPDTETEDIYMYNIVTGIESAVSTAPDRLETQPAIYDDKIVWCKSWDIYMYDVSAGTETVITTDPGFDSLPDIQGHKIVWEGDSPTEPYVKLLFLPLNWTGSQAAFNSSVDTQVSFFLNAIPLSACPQRLSVTALNVATQNFSTFTCTYPTNCGVGSIKPFVDTLGINTADYDVIVGLTTSSPCSPIAGCSNGADAVWVTTTWDVVTAHELGHIYDLEDEYCSNAAGSADCRCNDGDMGGCGDTGSDGAATGDVNWLDATLGCSPSGTPCCDVLWGDCSTVNYGICCRGNQNAAGGRCVMTYADAPGPRDFCAHCRTHLATKPQLNCSSPEPPESDQVIDLALRIYPDDAVQEERVILRKGKPTTHFGKGEDYNLAVSDPGGKVLWSQEFNIYFDYYGPVVSTEDYSGILYEFFPFACKIPYDPAMYELNLYHGRALIYSRTLDFCNQNGRCDPSETYLTCPGDCPLDEDDEICLPNDDGVCDPDCVEGVDPDCVTPPMEPCREIAFSTEEDFVTTGPKPADGNPIISDGDLLGKDCAVCARNQELLQGFDVGLDLGLDAVDVIHVETELVAFSTELDSPNVGQFTAGDLLATNGAIIPNAALTRLFQVDYDIGLDAIYFVGPPEGIIALLEEVKDLKREYWLENPNALSEMLRENGIDLWFSTEGTWMPGPGAAGFLDGDLLSAANGTIVAANATLLPNAVPAGIPNRGVDFGLDAVTGDRTADTKLVRFSTEILYEEDPVFNDGDVLLMGNGVVIEHEDLVAPCQAEARFLGLDALSGPVKPCEPSIDVTKKVFNPITGGWVDQIEAGLSERVKFRCEIHNDGTCCDLYNMTVTDILADHLEYANNATVNGVPREPDVIAENELTWFIEGSHQPSQTITIEFEAQVIGCGPGENVQRATAVCEETSQTVTDEDRVVVVGVGKPDLVITKIMCDRANNAIGYEITNMGCDVAPKCHYTGLWVDDERVCQDHVDVDLAYGETHEGWFECYQWPHCHTVAVQVCADINNVVDEMNEANNCRDGGCISAELEWTWNSTTVEPDYDQVMMAPVAADLNGDNIPDVIFSTFDTNWQAGGILRAISGNNGSELFSVTSPNYRVHAGAEPAVADIDDDGRPEIVVSKDSGEIICFEHDGTHKWTSTTVIGRIGIAVADLDQDGKPEIVAGRTVFNNDGTVRWTGTAGSSYVSVVADLDLDGLPEVVAGSAAYRYDGTLYWTSSPGGFPAIGNFDDDLYPEIVVVGSDQVSLKEHDGTVKWGPFSMPEGGGNGPPVVADMDGDGQPEIGVGGYDYYVAFETDGSEKWKAEIRDHSSRAASSTGFDFDEDGSFEIIYSDELFHRIFRGTDGAVLFETPGPSGTLLEHPFVVDVDNDGHAEIVAPVNNYAFPGNTGIEVYGNDTCWPDARGIWNQHTYHITNINDDATVPQVETNNWEVYNNYRVQSPPMVEEKPDLVITEIECDRENNRIGYEIKNIGDATAVAGHYTTLYVDGVYQIKDLVDVDLAPGATSQRYFAPYSWDCTPPEDEIEVCADIGDFVDESDETNNCKEETCRCLYPMLYIEPASATTTISGTTTVDIRIRDVTDLYGVQFYLSFDPSLVEVEDAVPGGDVNIEPGDFLEPGAVVYTNYVNNATGEIEYVQTRQGAVPGVDGSGVLARITFHGEAEGTSPVTFTLHILADPMSVPIEHDHADGEIVVGGMGSVSGRVILERRVNHPNANAGATVELDTQSQVTSDDGAYSFSNVPAGTHQIRVTHPSYLPTWRNVTVPAGGTIVLPDVELLGGDCSMTQGKIDGVDAVVMGKAWGSAPGDANWNERADVRDDSVIDVLDFTAVKFNWLRVAPGPWPGAASAAEAPREQAGTGSLVGELAAETTVVISPTMATTSIGVPVTVEVWVQDVEDLYGGGFQLQFDASVVNVQDANPYDDGVQIESGSWLERQLEAAHSVDNDQGEIDFFVTQSDPATPKSGSGVLARITFVGMAGGSTTLHFDSVQLVDYDENEIAASTEDGSVVVEAGYRVYLPMVLREPSTR